MKNQGNLQYRININGNIELFTYPRIRIGDIINGKFIPVPQAVFNSITANDILKVIEIECKTA